MTRTKHTELPWTIAERGPHNQTGEHYLFVRTHHDKAIIIASGLSKANAEFIVLAVNSFYPMKHALEAIALAPDAECFEQMKATAIAAIALTETKESL